MAKKRTCFCETNAANPSLGPGSQWRKKTKEKKSRSDASGEEVWEGKRAVPSPHSAARPSSLADLYFLLFHSVLAFLNTAKLCHTWFNCGVVNLIVIKVDSIRHFRVPKTLTFKIRPSSLPFL